MRVGYKIFNFISKNVHFIMNVNDCNMYRNVSCFQIKSCYINISMSNINCIEIRAEIAICICVWSPISWCESFSVFVYMYISLYVCSNGMEAMEAHSFAH